MQISLLGQPAPIFIPSDFDFEAEEAGCICTPGVINKSPGKGLLIEYKLTSGGTFTPDEVAMGISPSKVSQLSRLRLRLKVPVIIKPKTKFLLGVDHFQEQYQLNFIQPVFAQQLNLIAGTTLKSSRLTAYLLQSIGETNYIGLQARVAYNGNYSGVLQTNDYYRQIRFSAIWGVKKREDLEWGIGIAYSDNFTRRIALPFFLYNRTYNERWGLEAAFPVSILMRYNFTPRSLLLFGPEFSSAAYALRGEAAFPDEDYYFKHTELNFGAKYERELTPWIWVNVHAGLQINFDSEYQKVANNSELFEPDLITGAFLKIGLFLSPPN
ncbi:MAG: DUF6268 family outer membrane beta-barrel protein [Saprospiraceae bacterium]